MDLKEITLKAMTVKVKFNRLCNNRVEKSEKHVPQKIKLVCNWSRMH
jgi:hypothetical protein